MFDLRYLIMKTSSHKLPADAISLDQLKVGQSGYVGKIGHPNANHGSNRNTFRFDSQIDPDIEQRLMEIGFIPGEPLQVLHKGFFGGEPIAVKIGQSTFALRRFEAAHVCVILHQE